MNNYHDRDFTGYVAEHALARYTTKVFGWTFLGLALTAATVILLIMGAAHPTFAPAIAGASNVMLVIFIAQIGIVMTMGARIHKMRTATTKFLYMTYSISMGLFMMWIVLQYGLYAIGTAFAVTAVTFGIMAVYGVVTKQDLTAYRNILMFAIIGLVIAIVVNMFMGNTTLDLIISIAGIFIFLAFTVYDANRIRKNFYGSLSPDGEETALTENLAIHSALGLYLNFINLFLFLLRFMGRD